MPKLIPSPRRPIDTNRTLQLEATATIELEAASAEGTTLPRFRMVAYTGDPMRVAGWRHPVILDLAGLAIPSQYRPIRFGHDPLSGVGHTDSVGVVDGTLVAAGLVSRDTPAAREVVTSARNGFPWQASIGASVEEFEFVKESQQVAVNGRNFSGPVNVVRKATLGEISFVDLGADGRTSASVAAAKTEEDSDDDATLTAEELRAEVIAENERITAIRRICAGRMSELETRAIREGWDVNKTELELLRASRPSPTIVTSHDVPLTNSILLAACLRSEKMPEVERFVDERSLEAADRRYKGSIGLQELLLEAAWANGYTGRTFRESRTVLRYAFGVGIEAGFSTIDIGGILSNVANKFLLEGFFSVERTWRNICAVRNVNDFKTVTSYRLIGKEPTPTDFFCPSIAATSSMTISVRSPRFPVNSDVARG